VGQIENRKSKLETGPRAALLWGLAAFLALQAGLAAAIERRLPELRDPWYADKAIRLRRRVLDAPTRPLAVVVLGSSRTVYGLRASEEEPMLGRATGRPTTLFNFGLIGAGPIVELVVLRRLLADGVRPDLLLVEVLPSLFNRHVASYELGQLPAERLWQRELALLAHYGASYRELRRSWSVSCMLPWYAHRRAVLSRVAPSFLDWRERQDGFRNLDDSGWGEPPVPLLTPQTRRAAVELARRQYARDLADYDLGGPSCEALRDLLALCKRRDIPVALLWMPESATFRDWYPPAARAQIAAFMDEVSGRFDAPLVDARQWITDEDFADGHHLLPHGSAAFSERLAREALVPLLRGISAERAARRVVP
jgi:hypothetical protein